MRRLVTWLVVTLGIAALVRKLRKRDEPEWASVSPAPSSGGAVETAPAEEKPAEDGSDPAAELRERLARSRADMPSSGEATPALDDTVAESTASEEVLEAIRELSARVGGLQADVTALRRPTALHPVNGGGEPPASVR